MSNKIDVNMKTVMHYAIMILIMAVFYFIPGLGNGIVTAYGMKILGVFIGLVYGWTFVGMLVPSIIGAVALALAGLGTAQDVFVSIFNNYNIIMMIVGSLGFVAISQCNASDWVFAKILSSSIAKKSSVLMVGCIFAVVLILALVGMGILLMFVLFPIMNDFLKKCGYVRGEKFSILFLLGYMIAMQLPIGFLPFYSWGLLICGSMQSITGYAIPVGAYILLSVIIYMIFLLTYPVLMKVLGCDFTKLENIDVLQAFNVNPEAKLNLTQKITMGGMLLFIALVLLGSFVQIPIIQTIYGKIGVMGLMLAYWVAMLLIKIDGKPLLDMRKASEGMSWDLCILMAVALVLSSALTSAESGVGTWLAMMIGPLFSNVSEIGFLIIIALVLIVLTNLANNIAIVFILINVVASMAAAGVQINMLTTSIILTIGSCAVAYLTPASSLTGAILHGGEMIESKKLYGWNIFAMVYEFVLLMLVLIPATLLGIGA